VDAGTPTPLGATVTARGTNFAVFAPDATALTLALPGDAGSIRTVELPACTDGVWHRELAGVHAGDRYGFRAHGTYDPAQGRYTDESKLLADPYARAFDGVVRWDEALVTPGADTAGLVPWAVVVDRAPMPAHDRPNHRWRDSVVYELHVGGFTKRHPDVPAALRGTYAGLAHPASIDHLQRLGVTTVELLPVHQFADEPHLARRGLRNYWGYNTMGWSAPHAGYSASGTRGQQVDEFRDMVRTLHAAGLEVVLDVVYNHSAEGDYAGPTLSLRGLGDATYYRHLDRRTYDNVTGCGNTLDLREPRIVQLALDSLRCWVTEFGVDGFRFDLAPALARTDNGFDRRASFLACVAQDPVLAGVKLIAEPWDIGPGGYQLGAFPAPWSEWNGRYRDAARETWRGRSTRPELARRLAGSSDIFAPPRSPVASLNFVTSHDGFTLADVVSYDTKHNDANGEGNRDGDNANHSWNGGAEGPSTDPAVLLGRRSRRRSMLATLLLSAGVPMLRGGDELGGTQQGNNNAYCQDNEISWLDWSGAADPAGPDPALRALVGRLTQLRTDIPALRAEQFFVGGDAGDPTKDISWFAADGTELAGAAWDADQHTLGMYLAGDHPLLVWLRPGDTDTAVVLPGTRWAPSWQVVVDTALDDPLSGGTVAAGTRLVRAPWSVLVLRG
jgi:isoamylase